MKVTTVGIDLAKAVFQLHGVDESGQEALHKRLSRGRLLGYLANMESCLIGIEACAEATTGRGRSANWVIRCGS